MNVGFYTFGCKLNQAETEAIAGSFRQNNNVSVSISDSADIYIINTCTVTSKAEQKARRLVRKAAGEHPDSVIIVTGCYAQLEAETVSSLAPNVLVLINDQKHNLMELGSRLPVISALPVTEKIDLIKSELRDMQKLHVDELGRFDFFIDNYQFHSRAFIKIQDGCDNSCAYCRVPLARGKSISLDLTRLLERVAAIERAGYRELVLTGVNISSYRWEDRGLDEVLQQILAHTSSLRIRLSSLEPEQISDQLLGVIENPRICPHFHLPVQSGSDPVLKAMQRRYLSSRVYQAVDDLRRAKQGDDPFVAADLIVGFPGEGEEDFRRSLDLLEELRFSRVHVFPFSPRPGTKAWGMKKESVHGEVIKQRADAVHRSSCGWYDSYQRSNIGKIRDLLIERVEKAAPDDSNQTVIQGHTENYLNIHVPIPGSGADISGIHQGKLCSVRINELSGGILSGELFSAE